MVQPKQVLIITLNPDQVLYSSQTAKLPMNLEQLRTSDNPRWWAIRMKTTTITKLPPTPVRFLPVGERQVSGPQTVARHDSYRWFEATWKNSPFWSILKKDRMLKTTNQITQLLHGCQNDA